MIAVRRPEVMCTFRDEATVQVCDVAIGHVREAVATTFGDAVSCTALDEGGTLVQAASGVDLEVFGERTRAAIAAAQASQ
jgi:hypothetical protein